MAVGGSFDTFPKLLLRNAAQFSRRPAFRHKDLGIWQTWTWTEVAEIVRAYAAGLQRLGLLAGDTIAIVGSNRPKLYWTVMAAQSLRAIPVPVYSEDFVVFARGRRLSLSSRRATAISLH